MKKRFIAYCIGMFLATLAFFTNANAQTDQLDPSNSARPCEEVLGKDVDWNYPPHGILLTLECGCQIYAQYWLGSDEEGNLHISIGWYAIKDTYSTGCTEHTAKDWSTGKVYNIEEKLGDIENYIELQALLMAANFHGVKIDNPGMQIISSTVSCKQYISSSSYPGGLKLDGVFKKFELFENNFILTPIEESIVFGDWSVKMPCAGTACCVAYVNVEYDESKRPACITSAFKSSVIADELSGQCIGPDCKYACDNLSYEFLPSDPHFKSLETQIMNDKIKILPNPNDGDFMIENNLESEGLLAFTLANLEGKVVLEGSLEKGLNTISASKALNSGSYQLVVKDKVNILFNTKIIITK
jgi:hypothetical protein